MVIPNTTPRKRAKVEDNETRPPASKKAKKSGTPTKFLSLLRELRQSILYKTYKDDITVHDSFQAFMDRVTEEKGFYCEHEVQGCISGFNNWVQSIKDIIHQSISEDMEYVKGV